MRFSDKTMYHSGKAFCQTFFIVMKMKISNITLHGACSTGIQVENVLHSSHEAIYEQTAHWVIRKVKVN